MLGHELLKSYQNKFETFVTLKNDKDFYDSMNIFTDRNSFFGVNVLDNYTLIKTIVSFKPDVIINSLGVIKYRGGSSDMVSSLEVNSLFPYRLTNLVREMGIRVITFSTDCVFAGDKGMYKEDDLTDANDIYGRTKAIGEVYSEEKCLTLRTSFFGLELKYFTGLIEWFLQSKGDIKGFSKAIYSGLTTTEISRIVERIIVEGKHLHGLYHVSSDPINKYALLLKLQEKLGKGDIQILEDSSFTIDRSLNSERFRKSFNYVPPTWDQMLNELARQIKNREEKL